MFYYPTALQRNSGCFATIWLAATRGIKINRREMLKVNIWTTCGDIVNYVTARVPAPQPHLPKPRFSLYLSSQLQYGVVVVYHQQCGFLLKEIQQMIDRLLRMKVFVQIDMAETDRLALDVPDLLNMMEGTEGAEDPFFGLMGSEQLPSPYKLPQTEFLVAEHFQVSDSPNAIDAHDSRTSRATITLTEKEPFVIAGAEDFVGNDLSEPTAQEIDLLMDQPDVFSRRGEEKAEERMMEPEGVLSSIDQLKETVVGTDPDSLLLRYQDAGQTGDRPLAPESLEVTPPRVAVPTPPSRMSGTENNKKTGSSPEEVADDPVREPRAKRRRRLFYDDLENQIPDQVMKEQINDVEAETLDLAEVMLDFFSLGFCPSLDQLFDAPSGCISHPHLMSLWKKQARITVLPDSDREEEEEEEGRKEESEQDQEILRAERRTGTSGVKEVSSDFGLQAAEASSAMDVVLDVSKEDKSAGEVITPVSRWSLQEELKLPMDPIAEENIEMPEAQIDAENRNTMGWISSVLQKFNEVSFDSLLPPLATPGIAAEHFYVLLELLSTGQAKARQTKPYGVIKIYSTASVSI